MEPIKTTVGDLDLGIELGRNHALGLGARGDRTTGLRKDPGDHIVKTTLRMRPPDFNPSPQPPETGGVTTP